MVGSKQVRLVLPLRVVEELDEKKYTARSGLADRARRLLSQLRTKIADSDDSQVPLGDGAVLEVYVPGEPRQRTADADQEVLNTCLQLQAAGADLYLVTDDAGLHIRAHAQDLAVCPMPANYLRNEPGQN